MIKRSALDSGPRVVTESMPQVSSATVGIWVPVGARHEAGHLQGCSHLLEHLLFKGTETRSQLEISEAFDSIGGFANAYTTLEYTYYHAGILGSDASLALEILADMVTSPRLDPSDLEKERNVILEEMALLEDAPEEWIHSLARNQLFGDHPLGREIMGTKESISEVDREAIKGFFEENYDPATMVVAAAGAIDHDEICQSAAKVLPKGRDGTPKEPLPPHEATPSVSKLERETEAAHVVASGRGYEIGHELRYAWALLDEAIGGGAASRLVQEIREDRGLAYSVYSYRDTFKDGGMWAVYAGTSPDSVDEVIELVGEQLASCADNGLSASEITRVKGQARGSILIEGDKPSVRATRLGRTEIVGQKIEDVETILDRIESVTSEDISQVANDLFKDRPQVLTLIAP